MTSPSGFYFVRTDNDGRDWGDGEAVRKEMVRKDMEGDWELNGWMEEQEEGHGEKEKEKEKESNDMNNSVNDEKEVEGKGEGGRQTKQSLRYPYSPLEKYFPFPMSPPKRVEVRLNAKRVDKYHYCCSPEKRRMNGLVYRHYQQQPEEEQEREHEQEHEQQENRLPLHEHGKSGQASMDLLIEMLDVEMKKKAIIQAKKEKIGLRILRIENALKKKKEEERRQEEHLKWHMEKQMEEATRNRDAIIQRQIEHCAAEVEKAKNVCMLQREKDLAARDKMREKIEARLKSAEMRAKIHQLHKLAYAEKEIYSHLRESAAVKIQRKWRRIKFARPIRDVLRYGLKLDRVRTMEFEILSHLLQEVDLLRSIRTLLERIAKASHINLELPKNTNRLFLTSYIIVIHENAIFEEKRSLERDLKHAAVDMLEEFELFLATYNDITAYQHLQRFIEYLNHFLRRFLEWKSPDAVKLIDNLVAQYIGLDNIKASVKADKESASEWFPEVEKQQRRVVEELLRIGGKEVLGRLPEDASQFITKRNRNISFSMVAPQSPMKKDSKRRKSAENLSETNTDLSIQSNEEASLPIAPTDIYDKKPFTSQEYPVVIRDFSLSTLSNQQLAHEIVLDPEFQLNVPETSSLESKVRQVAKRAFWNRFREMVEHGDYSEVPLVIADLKKDILELLPVSDTNAKNDLEEVLDIDLIHQQVEKGVFELFSYLKYMVSAMKQICAPIRDEEVSQLATIIDPIEALAKMFDVIENMKLDVANHHLKIARPLLSSHIVEYERKQFNQFLQSSGEHGLDKLRARLTLVAKEIESGANSSLINSKEIFNQTLLSIITATEPANPETLPEPWHLDIHRLFGFQNEVQAIILIASLIMISKNLVPALANDSMKIKSLKNTLQALLAGNNVQSKDISNHICSSINHYLTEHHDVLSPERENTLRSLIDKSISTEDRLYLTLLQRLKTVLSTYLKEQKIDSEDLKRFGFDLLSDEIVKLASQLDYLAIHHREVYAKYYDQILYDILHPST